MGRPRSGRLPFFGFGLGEGQPGLGGGNVGIWPLGQISKGRWAGEGNLAQVFPSVHGPVISTAFDPAAQRKRGGGNGDSIFTWHNSLVLAAFILCANSVSLMVPASRSSAWKPMPSFR
jgi:hypothetical protein